METMTKLERKQRISRREVVFGKESFESIRIIRVYDFGEDIWEQMCGWIKNGVMNNS